MFNRNEFIAEIGWNFMGDLGLAEKMIASAKRSGANIAKFQYWNPKKLKDGPWFNDGRIEIYKVAAIGMRELTELRAICLHYEIEFLCSAFNVSDAKFLCDNGLETIKIPSHEVYNCGLHEYAAQNFKRIYVSLGAGSAQEVKAAIEIYNSYNIDWVGMHCVSSYPCPIEKANLLRINWLRQSGVKRLGFSDHTSEIFTPSLATMLGVNVIEKHFTIDKNLPGRDNKFALNAAEFKQMVDFCNMAQLSVSIDTVDSLDIELDTIRNYRGRWGK